MQKFIPPLEVCVDLKVFIFFLQCDKLRLIFVGKCKGGNKFNMINIFKMVSELFSNVVKPNIGSMS